MHTSVLSVCILLSPLLIHLVASSQDDGVTNKQKCAGCRATIKEITNRINSILQTTGKSDRSAQIKDVIAHVFKTYPSTFKKKPDNQKAVKSCIAILDEYKEDIVAVFIKDRASKVSLICEEITGVCNGFDKDGKQIKQTGGTLSKEDKKKKSSKKAGKKGDKADKQKVAAGGTSGGTEKGALHNLNVDINDPDAMARVMEQIKRIQEEL